MPGAHQTEPGPDPALRELRDDPSSRKRFLKMVGGAGAAGALSVVLAACGGDDEGGGQGAATQDTAAKPREGGDLEIVNYALTLEYLEAEFYRRVIDSGAIKDKAVVELAKAFGDAEQEHVEALRKTAQQLGKPADKPRTNFDAVLEGGPKMILETAATVENVGAAAYLGQAGRIRNKEILAAALSIHTVEARHAAALNQLVGRDFKGGKATLEGSVPDGAFAKPLDMQAVLKQIQPFLAA